MMRKGMKPVDACLEALGRVARNYNGEKKKLATFHLYYYAVNKDGEFGSASLWKNGYESGKVAKFSVGEATGSRLETCRAFFEEGGGGQEGGWRGAGEEGGGFEGGLGTGLL